MSMRVLRFMTFSYVHPVDTAPVRQNQPNNDRRCRRHAPYCQVPGTTIEFVIV
jgi:hypothetical protein